MSEWICVKNQLPPINSEIILYNGKKEVVFGIYKPESPPVENWATDDSIWIYDNCNVNIGTATHWMPLPLPPQDEIK